MLQAMPATLGRFVVSLQRTAAKPTVWLQGGGVPRDVPRSEGPQKDTAVPRGPRKEAGGWASLEGSKLLPFPGLLTRGTQHRGHFSLGVPHAVPLPGAQDPAGIPQLHSHPAPTPPAPAAIRGF